MAILQVRDIDEELYNALKNRAKQQNRSISQEVLSILEHYLSNPNMQDSNAAREFVKLSASWEDSKSADEIIDSIHSARSSMHRFGDENAVFD